MKSYPDSPKEWDAPINTVNNDFYFRNDYDTDILIRLVEEHIPNKGNDSYLRARLVGILRSYSRRLFVKNYLRRNYPKTYLIRFYFRQIRRWYFRKFNTKFHRSQVELSEIAKDVIESFKSQ